MNLDLILIVKSWYIKNSEDNFKQIINSFPGSSTLADHSGFLKNVAIFLEIF